MKKICIFAMVISFCLLGLKVVSSDNNVEFLTHLKNCQNYSQNNTSNSSGMNISYKLDIVGWKENKCVLNMTAKIDMPTSSNSLSPVIKCEFTREQIEKINNEINSSVEKGQLLSDATNEKIMNIVSSGNSCQLQQMDNIEKFSISE